MLGGSLAWHSGDARRHAGAGRQPCVRGAAMARLTGAGALAFVRRGPGGFGGDAAFGITGSSTGLSHGRCARRPHVRMDITGWTVFYIINLMRLSDHVPTGAASPACRRRGIATSARWTRSPSDPNDACGTRRRCRTRFDRTVSDPASVEPWGAWCRKPPARPNHRRGAQRRTVSPPARDDEASRHASVRPRPRRHAAPCA